ncbi:UNVERIFIED_CONTAM: hypothetical protein Scaly_1062600 [Sesamum calycinum]|uniref:Integrase catalytic domain-containing protein n=1 Tax=Sesamum calycinum TaxID=2727403 RepID=A0AAW2QKN9_9LAMI
MARIQFDKYIKVVRSDNVTGFTTLRTYFEEIGIEFQTSCVDTPQQNGRVEHKRRHILNMGRALRFQANPPLTFWGKGSPSCVLRHSERSCQPNTRLKDYICLTARCVDPSASPTIQSSSSDPRWCDAMAKEIVALESNGTWTIEDLPPASMPSDFKAYLSHFHMKDLGWLKYFLGIEIARGPYGLSLTQRKYTLDILSEVGTLGTKPADLSIEQNHNLSLDDGPLFDDLAYYCCLIYLTIIRPELCYVVHILAQFMHSPRDAHWEAALRVLLYLKGHPGQGILLRHDSALHLNVYCDSNWASSPLIRLFTAIFILLGNSNLLENKKATYGFTFFH